MSRSASSVSSIRDSSAAGIAASLTAGTKRPRRLVQNRLVANAVDHHRRHLTSVRRVIPSSDDNAVTDFFDGPCCSAVARMTTAPT